MTRVPHIVWTLVALVLVLAVVVGLTVLGHPVPKLVDAAILLVGAIAGLARGDVPPGSEN